ncbi:MAG: cytochrome B [Pedobacter sp.]|nr:cytochrome B [Pedobacter sp.]
MNTYEILKNAHSGWRYVVIILLLIAVINAVMGWMGNKSYTEGNRKLNVFTLISAHIQLVFGVILYFLSPLTKGPMADAMYRYWKVEHVVMMVLAIVLITIGNAKSKKGIDGVAKHKSIAIFFGIALIIIVVAIFTMVSSDPSKSLLGFG